jgi:leader peptidase (prepilin peptidase)/N-methyltransferase
VTTLQVFYLVSLVVFGLIFGSFANVVIWRLPRGESVVSPGSHCPSCAGPIRPYDNIPVISWLVLRGRCRDCGEPIHWRYPLVEALSAAAWLSAGLAFGMHPRALVALVLFYLLLILAFIDLDVMRLPNALVAAIAAVGFGAAAVAQLTGVRLAPLTQVSGAGPLAQPLLAAVAGSVLGGGFIAVLNWGYTAMRGRKGFGMGDVKLAAASGAYLGPYVLLALMFGSLFAVIGGLALTAGEGAEPRAQRRFPFGPFLAFGIVTAAVTGPALVGLYLRAILP